MKREKRNGRFYVGILVFAVMFAVIWGKPVYAEEATSGTPTENGQEAENQEQQIQPEIALSTTKVTLFTGKANCKIRVNAQVTGESQQIQWMSGDPKVAKVNAQGEITAVNQGKTLVSATANGITRSVLVQVKNPTITVKKGSKKVGTVTVTAKKKTTLNVKTNPTKAGLKLAKQNKKSKSIATVTLRGGKLYVTGKKTGVTKVKLSSGKTVKYITVKVEAPKRLSAFFTPNDQAPYYIKVNRQANCVTIYGKDKHGNYTVPVRAMVCSVGKNNGTPTGVFRTSTKYIWRPLYGNVYGQYAFRINGPILFHTVPYTTTDKGALEYDEYNKLGQAASLGCVRLSVSDMKWIYDNCPSGTMVEIYDSPNPGPLGKPTFCRIDPYSPYRGWDPTDPDMNNPWRSIPPTIHSPKKRTVERGEKVDYMENVYATNYLGERVKVAKSGKVKTNKCGTYTITYTARDGFGNVTKKKVKFTVKDTIKPTLTVSANLEINDQNAANVASQILSVLTAKDGKDNLAKSRISVDCSTVRDAVTAKAYGTYVCTAYVKDLAGNKSNSVKIIVTYRN